MDTAQTFSVNAPKVVYELFDGDVVIVNLDTGNYFSTEKVGAQIWQYVIEGRSLGQILDQLQSDYSADSDQITQTVTAFIEQLQSEAILLPAEASAGTPAAQTSQPTSPSANGSTDAAFTPPELKRHTDMQDLLLLDPIHEVDDTGWPAVAPASE